MIGERCTATALYDNSWVQKENDTRCSLALYIYKYHPWSLGIFGFHDKETVKMCVGLTLTLSLSVMREKIAMAESHSLVS